ncbi:hypothetical protein [Paenibacillus rigui]|uniref:Uncharacterized protein n=1 Tax=Paenibacillus rigui TaxID=554312 RepID=A0A229UW99_9BACL|nr:hypothetical protein [Paenibacillus rigui]OXM87650.1 hypothetical protein CF651_04030 [Paenibacillus rigui]
MPAAQAIKSIGQIDPTLKQPLAALRTDRSLPSMDEISLVVLDLSNELKGAEIIFKGEGTGIRIGDHKSAEFGPMRNRLERNTAFSAIPLGRNNKLNLR